MSADVRTQRVVGAAFCLGGLCLLSAQPPADQKAQMQQTVAALKQSIAENQKALQQYSWVETTQISLKGEVKKQEQKQCRYGTDGKVIKTPMAGAEAAPPKEPAGGGGRGRRGGGAVKAKVIENKVEDMKEYMGDVSALVKQYVPPDPAKIQSCQQAGKIAVNKEPTGVTAIALMDYAQPGDQMTLGFNMAAKAMAGVNVNTYLGKEKDTVTLGVRFAALPDGVTYPAETTLVAKAKEIQVKITNSGYKKGM